MSIMNEIDYEQCKECGWNLSYGCSQQERRPKKGDICPTKKKIKKKLEKR